MYDEIMQDAEEYVSGNRDLTAMLKDNIKRKSLLRQDYGYIPMQKYRKYYQTFDRFYQMPKYEKYSTFENTKSSLGIPKNAKIFQNFDPINSLEIYPKYSCIFKSVTSVDYHHVYDYLQAPEMNKRLLSTRKYDHIVYGILAFLLEWETEDLQTFGREFKYEKLTSIIIAERANEDYKYLYSYKGLPFMKHTFKLLRKYLVNEKKISPGRSLVFNWFFAIDHDFNEHIHDVYNKLITNSINGEMIECLEADMKIMYRLDNICDDVEKLRGTSTFKFISGQACCGKTSLLNTFRSNGWQIYSRGDCGSFSGKATNPAAVGCLHSALDFMLNRPNVIGDRGYIDNILWVFIMEACDPKKKSAIVNNMFRFFNANFNEPSIANFIAQKGVIFIDPYPEKNIARMLARCMDGDAHRARINLYPIVQFIVYYTAARLFGWKVVCVPYDSATRQFKPSKYIQIGNMLQQYFGKPIDTGRKFVSFAKPPNDYIVNNEYPKEVGIFK